MKRTFKLLTASIALMLAMATPKMTSGQAAVLPFSWPGGPKADLILMPGVQTYGLGTDYAASNDPYRIKFDHTGDYIQVNTDGRPGNVSIGVKMIGGSGTSSIIVRGSDDGILFFDIEVLTISGDKNDILSLESSALFFPDHRYVRMEFNKGDSGSNVGIGPISIGSHVSTGTYHVFYHGNGSDGGSVPTDGIAYAANAVVTVAGCGDMTKSGNVFASWNTMKNGSGTVLFPEDTFIITRDTILFAQWTPNPFAKYVLIDSNTQLIPGTHYLLVGKDGDNYYGMGVQNTTSRGAVALDPPQQDTLVGTNDLYEFVVSGSDSDLWTVFDPTNASKGYLYAASNSSNHLKTKSTLTDDGTWTIGFNDDHTASLNAQGDNSHRWLRFNPNNGNPLFSCYTSSSTTGSLPYLYRKCDDTDYHYYSTTTLANLSVGTDERHVVHSGSALTVTGTMANTDADRLIIEDGAQLRQESEGVAATIKRTVNAYHTGPDVNDGWAFVAAPFTSTLAPSIDNGLLAGTYDLYAYDETSALWSNHKANPIASLENGQGYLYANADETTLTLAGTLQPNDDPVTVPLDYHPGNALSGWNLVGNPFPCNAYLNRSYYVMNSEGSNVEAVPDYEENAIAPGRGALVQASNLGEEVQFNTSPVTRQKGSKSRLEITVNAVTERNPATLDKAFVCFQPEHPLEKFVFSPSQVRLWIPKNGKNYAIANAEGQEEIPICFKTEKEGSYSLRFETKKVENTHLLLIDNLTGASVDPATTPTYAFEAKPRDYEARFRLVFDNTTPYEPTDFAVIINGRLHLDPNLVSSCPEAKVQVIDMQGRVLHRLKVSSAMPRLTPGVYVLQLIEETLSRTQRIISKP